MLKDNPIYNRSFGFAVRIVKMYKYMTENKKEYVLSKQVLRSGTSIGANVREAIEAQSKKDFIAKLYIALKEAGETEYWIKLLVASEYLEKEHSESLLSELHVIIKILNTIIKKSKSNMNVVH